MGNNLRNKFGFIKENLYQNYILAPAAQGRSFLNPVQIIAYLGGLDAFVSEPAFLLLRRVVFCFFFAAVEDFRGAGAAFLFWDSGPNPKKAPGKVRVFALPVGPVRPGRFLVVFLPLRWAGRLPRAARFETKGLA